MNKNQNTILNWFWTHCVSIRPALRFFFSLYGEWNRICIQEIWVHYFANETTMPLQDMYGALSATRQTCLLPILRTHPSTPHGRSHTYVKQCNICFGCKCRLFCSTLIKKTFVKPLGILMKRVFWIQGLDTFDCPDGIL